MNRPKRNVKAPKVISQVIDDDSEDEIRFAEASDYSEEDENDDSPLTDYTGSEDEDDDEVNAGNTVNEILTESQVAHARLLIPEQEKEVDQLQAQYDAQKQALSLIGERLKAANDRLFHTRAKVAAIRRLPLELLGEIFVLHVRDNKQSPWLLMQVCRAWRNAALLTRAVWGAILIAPPSWTKKKGGGRMRIFNGKEVCVTQNQLRRALNRAGATPLDLQITFGKTKNSRYGYAFFGGIVHGGSWKQQSQIQGLLNAVKAYQPNARIRSLEIDTSHSHQFPIHYFDQFDFRPLETLKLDCKYPELIKKITSEATRIRVFSVLSGDLQELTNKSFLPHLEELEIRDNLSIPSEQAVKIRAIITSATSLRTLRVHGGVITRINEQARIDLPTLQILELNRTSCFWPIECSNITHLTLSTGWSVSERVEKRSIVLPRLEVFAYKSESSISNLQAFEVPNLREFVLEGGHSKSSMRSGMMDVWKDGIEPNINPVSFRLQSTVVHQDVVAKLVNALTRAETVEIKAVSMPSSFFSHLVPKLRPQRKMAKSVKPPPTWLYGARKMKVLVVDFAGCKVKEEMDVFERVARELLDKRMEAGAALEKIDLRVSEEEGWTSVE